MATEQSHEIPNGKSHWALDAGLDDDELAQFELQENTEELDHLVEGVRVEIEKHHSPVDPAKTRIPGPVEENSTVAAKKKFPKPKTLNYVIRPPHGPKGISTGKAHFSDVGNVPDLDVKGYLQAVMERLSRLEYRLEAWNMEQQDRVERALTGKAGPARPRNTWVNSRPDVPPAAQLSTRPIAEEPSTDHRAQKEDAADGFLASEDASLNRSTRATGLKRRETSGSIASNDSELRQKRRTVCEQVLGAEARERISSSKKTSGNAVQDETVRPGGYFQQRLSQLVYHPAFDYFFATLILLNSLFIGVQTEWRVAHIGVVQDPGVFDVAEKIFAAMFACELVLRMAALKTAFFARKGLAWNLFDMLLVVMSIVEVILTGLAGGQDTSDTSGNAGKVVRMFRMARIVRVMRVLRFLAELRIMVTLIIHSAMSLFWLMILLILILYIFSIFFTQGVTDFLNTEGNTGTTAGLLRQSYGSMGLTAFTLFASIAGGVSWRDVIYPLSQTGWVFTSLFIVYIFFAVFSVLNIVTGVFVDGAIQRSSQERDLRLEKEKEQKKTYVSMLMDLLEEIDVEGTGVITRAELEEAFKSEQVRYYFSVLDIDVVDSNYLFDMLDLDRSGEVDMEEFVSGCLRLKGNAKSIDIHTLMFEIKIMIKQITAFMEYYGQAQRAEGRPSFRPSALLR